MKMNSFPSKLSLVLSKECSHHLNGRISHRQGQDETSDVRHSLFVGTFRSFQLHFLCIRCTMGFFVNACGN